MSAVEIGGGATAIGSIATTFGFLGFVITEKPFAEMLLQQPLTVFGALCFLDICDVLGNPTVRRRPRFVQIFQSAFEYLSAISLCHS